MATMKPSSDRLAEPGLLSQPGVYEVELIQKLRVVPTILRILCDSTGLGYSAIGRVTETQWLACAVLDRLDFGLAVGGELDVGTTFCKDVRRSRAPLVIDNATADPLFCSSLVPRQYGFESYIAVPIILADGEVWGTICGFDPKPATLRGTQILPTLQMFAELLAGQIDNERRLEESVTALDQERALGELREQFVAVLGHDLRNPVAAVLGGLRVLERDNLADRSRTVVEHMRASCDRITGLIDATLDLARGRLGGGIPVDRQVTTSLTDDLKQVIQEIQVVHPINEIQCDIRIAGSMSCDRKRVGQLLSNLLANAFTHGAADRPIKVTANSEDGRFLLSVENGGTPIPADKMPRLFHPFERAGSDGKVEGLGLGLYIAAEIAKAHGGSLAATSSQEATVFTFEMPTGRSIA